MTQLHEPGTREAILAEVGDRHPSTLHVLGYFAWAHLPPRLQEVSTPCADLALQMCDRLGDGPELTVGLRKLLEAKDALVRAALDAGVDAPPPDVPATGAGPRP